MRKIIWQGDNMKGGKAKMNKKVLLWVVIGALFLVVLYLVFAAGTGSSAAVQGAGSAVQSSSSSMVGGC